MTLHKNVTRIGKTGKQFYSCVNKKEKIITRVTIIALQFRETTLHKIRYCPSIMHDITQQHNRDR